MPRVTIAIATYNRSRVLRSALRSVLAQTCGDFEVWVVGDACTDDSEAVVASFGDNRLHWVNLPVRVGAQYGPNNEALRRASGEFVAYLGHDDLWFPWHLESLVQTAEREQADFTYGGVLFLGPDGAVEAHGNPKRRAYVSAAPPSGWLHRRTIVDTCGPWRAPDSEPVGQDVGFQARAFEAGFRFAPTRRFSVLKFPSHRWRLYAEDADLPQERTLERMRQDAVGLEAEVLTQMVFAYSSIVEDPSVTGSLKAAVRAAQRAVGDWYGVTRWPVSAYLKARDRSRRRARLVTRGLTGK